MDATTAIAAFIAGLDERADTWCRRWSAAGARIWRRRWARLTGWRATAMHEALESEEPELLHEWRKQAKYHALQARLMRQQFPDALDRRVAGVRDLAELLGEVQDIEVVAAGAKGWRERPAGFLEVLDARRKSLVTGARAAGAALFSEKPKAWMKDLTPPVMAE